MSSNQTHIHRFIRTNPDKTARISFVLAALAFCYLMASAAATADSPGERMVMIRYLNFVLCGFFAFIIPHVRFPDRKRFLLQSLNLSPAALLRYTASSLAPVFVLFSVMLGLLAFFDPGNPLSQLESKAVTFLSGWLLMFGIGLMAVVRYISIGAVSQEWQEGRRGAGFLNALRNTGQPASMPPGSFPSLLTTISVAGGGMLLVVAGAWLAGVTGKASLEMIPGAILVLYAGIRIGGIKAVFDRLFYHTNAFYAELFLNPKAVQEGREPLRHDALYWVPARWKPAAWFSLLQLDRKQPIGRLLVTGHLILWTLFYAGLSDGIISTYITLLILGKTLLSYLLVTRPFAPLLFQYRLLAPSDWIVVRFFHAGGWWLYSALACH